MKHNWLVTIALLSLFLLAQVIGLAVVKAYVNVPASAAKGSVVWKGLPAIAGYQMQRPETGPGASVAYIAAAIILGTLLILFIVRWQKVILWKLWFWLAVMVCLHIALSAFVKSSYAAVIATAFASLKVFRPGVLVHNLTELFVYGGLAAIFVPLLNPFSAVALLLLVSLYDAYAVWHSGHMVRLARFQARSGIFAGLLLPYSFRQPVLKRQPAKGKVRAAVLGGGDIGFPLLFAGVMLGSSGAAAGVLVSICATASLFLLLYFGRKSRFYPAMPFLTAGCLAGWLLGLLL